MDQTDRIIQVEPFPSLRWDEYHWVGTVMLNSWQGFQTRLGPYDSVSSEQPSDGTIHIMVHTKDAAETMPAPEQIRAFSYLLAHEQVIRDAVVQAIFSAYPGLREELIEEELFDEDELKELMPPITHPDDLKALIGPAIVHVNSDAKDGIAYVGFEFGCTWEEEHGLGVLTLQDRVVHIGQADESFDIIPDDE